jgi:hypothetical protein
MLGEIIDCDKPLAALRVFFHEFTPCYFATATGAT